MRDSPLQAALNHPTPESRWRDFAVVVGIVALGIPVPNRDLDRLVAGLAERCRLDRAPLRRLHFEAHLPAKWGK